MASLLISPQLAPPPFSSSSSSSSTSPSKTYTFQYDCPYGICTFYCPQWCILPPPPPLFLNSGDTLTTDDASSSHISPLMAALIAVLAASFLLLFYFTVFSKFFRNRRNNNRSQHSSSPFLSSSSGPVSARSDPLVARSRSGLDDAFIRQITVFKYNKDDKLVDGTECAVCLSEFNEGENLRLMPNCQHAFHIPCIDTWLKTHSNCPLCRSTMNPLPVHVPVTSSGSGSDNINSNPSNLNSNSNSNSNSNVSVAALRMERRSNDVVLVVREVNNRVEVVEPAHGVGEVGSDNLDERDSKLQVNNDIT